MLLDTRWQVKVDEAVWDAIREGAERWCEMHEDADMGDDKECA
jgi:hypothetical protein